MRLFWLLLMMLGVVGMASGVVVGCSGLINHNGRHEVARFPITIGAPMRTSFPALGGRRYSAGVQVVFERNSQQLREETELRVKLPIAGALDDGETRVTITGYLDPSNGQTSLVGRASGKELFVERLVGPHLATTDRPLRVELDDGADEGGELIVQECRLILYDDEQPRSVRYGFVSAGAGLLLFAVSGIAVMISSLKRNKRS